MDDLFGLAGLAVLIAAFAALLMPFIILLSYGELKRIRKALERKPETSLKNPTFTAEELQTIVGRIKNE